MSLKRKQDEPKGREQVEDPIPRPLPLQSITLNFKQMTWQEIAPGKMYYLPMSYTPYPMFDEHMKRQFAKFALVAESIQVHTPHIKISNLIMLQDDLRVQNSTPTDATAFTQVCYMMHWVPRHHQQGFCLAKRTGQEMSQYEILKINSLLPANNNTQLVEVENFSSFEDLLCIPLKSSEEGV